MNEIYKIITLIGFDNAMAFLLEFSGREIYFKREITGILNEIKQIIGEDQFQKLQEEYRGNKIYIRARYERNITHLQIISDYENKRYKIKDLTKKYKKSFQSVRNVIKNYQSSPEKEVIKEAIKEMELTAG